MKLTTFFIPRTSRIFTKLFDVSDVEKIKIPKITKQHFERPACCKGTMFYQNLKLPCFFSIYYSEIKTFLLGVSETEK